MLLFSLLWLIAITIVLSVHMVIGIYWYRYIYNHAIDFFVRQQQFKNNSINQQEAIKSIKRLETNLVTHSDIFVWWFLFFINFFFGILLGWFIEKNFKPLRKIQLYWQKTQPEFYKNTRAERRVFLPWLLVEIPLLIIAILNILILIQFSSYNFINLSILFIIIGFTIGQLIELIKEHDNIMKFDRPPKPPESLLKKVYSRFPFELSIFLGQLYCKVLIPFLFLYITIIAPRWIIFMPNYSEKKFTIAILFIIIGVMIKWYFDKEDNFYFEKITLTNVLFTTLKLLILASFVILSIVSGVNIIILILASSISGYFISWHPEKFRE